MYCTTLVFSLLAHFSRVSPKVFPGGNLDKQDESIQMTAIRETFEETGLLLATRHTQSTPSPLSDHSVLHNARHAIHNHNLNFQDFLRKHDLLPDTESLLPFTSWITPPDAPRYFNTSHSSRNLRNERSCRRFHTQFFVSFLPSASAVGFLSGDKEEVVPTSGQHADFGDNVQADLDYYIL
jgi:8-oxo-dGTP pyrophosphatase MutT (NUDIX family)